MKLVSFSPWQHTATSIPSSSSSSQNNKHEHDDIIQNFIISPATSSTIFNNNLHSSKRIKSIKSNNINGFSKNRLLVSSLDMHPTISITSNHRITILGHPQSKNILRNSNSTAATTKSTQDDDITILKEVPQWIYASRPGPTTSFFPNNQTHSSSSSSSSSHSIPKLGAVIDPTSRTIFVLQNNNHILKVWGLNDDVTGPDDDNNNYDNNKGGGRKQPSATKNTTNYTSTNPIHKVKFDSPVLCINLIPIRHQVRVKIKDDENKKEHHHHVVHGGVTGLLMNGQMFVVLVCDETTGNKQQHKMREIKVGIFGNNDDLEKKKVSNNNKNEYIYSVVGFTAGGGERGGGGSNSGSRNTVSVGTKRKLEYVNNDSDDDDDELGEITLTSISRNSKQSDCISFTKHAVIIPSLKGGKAQNNHDRNIDLLFDGIYSQDVGDVKLPHDIFHHKENGNGSSFSSHKDALVTQMDVNHVCLVYQDSSQMWYCTMLDTRYGECVIKPFPLFGNGTTATLKQSCPSVVGVGGLGSSILAVLTSESLLKVYDVRRAVHLHEIKLHMVLGKEEGSDGKHTFSIAAHWFTGTIGIMCNTKGNKGSTVSVSCARVGVYDREEGMEVMEAGKKPFAKGTYNLARIISSSLATSKNSNKMNNKPQLIECDLTTWYPMLKRKINPLQSNDSKNVSDLIIELEKYRQGSLHQNGSKPKSFIEKFEELVQKLTVEQSEKEGKNRDVYTSLPQSLIDTSFSIALQVIFTRDNNHKEKISATKVLFRCIESKKVSVRNQLHTTKNGTLRNLLLSLNTLGTEADESKSLSLQLISSLLQHCDEGITEEMLVSMIHFVICYATNDQFEEHWHTSHDNSWYNNPDIKVLEKRLKTATKKMEDSNGRKTESRDELNILAQNLANRLALRRQLFFIGKIVTKFQCNPALLRSSLRNGLTQVNAGEVDVLILALGKLLRQVGNNKRKKDANSPNRLTCISQWLSAVVDTQLGHLLSGENVKTIDRVTKEVSTSILQTKTILSLKEIFNQVDKMIVSKKDTEDARMDIAPVPLYGIEPLIF